MTDLETLLPNFGSLKEYRDFLDSLVEKINDGEEIARGKNPNDKSKQEKSEEEVPEEGEMPPAEGGEEAMEPIVDPVAAPGSQIKVGNKHVEKDAAEPKAKEIKISGKADKIDMKPSIEINHNTI